MRVVVGVVVVVSVVVAVVVARGCGHACCWLLVLGPACGHAPSIPGHAERITIKSIANTVRDCLTIGARSLHSV